jgi:hypothetical protein
MHWEWHKMIVGWNKGRDEVGGLPNCAQNGNNLNLWETRLKSQAVCAGGEESFP